MTSSDIKTFFYSIWGKITTTTKSWWAWVKQPPRQWLFLGIVALLWITITSFQSIVLERKIKALEAKSANITEKVDENSKKLSDIVDKVAENVDKLQKLQKTNDAKVVRASATAAKKVSAMSDSDVADSWSAFLSAVQQRNSGRNND